jgi:two-component system CheB/CheR fusion protein
MSGTASLGDHLNTRADAIIALWRSAVTRDRAIPEANQLSYPEFADHIPELLDRIAARLRGLPASVTVPGIKHGRIRWRQGYDIAHVVSELGHLRNTLTRTTFEYARSGALDGDEVEASIAAMHDVLDEAMAESVAQFQEESIDQAKEVLQDVARRQSELAAERVAAEVERIKLKTILASLPVGVWVFDAEGTIQQVNREGERLQGFPASEVVGQVNIYQQIPYRVTRPGGSPILVEEHHAVRALRGEEVEQEEILWHQEDRTRSVIVSAAPLIAPSGQIRGALVVVQDITERKHAEELLLRQHAFNTAITKSLADAVAAMDIEGRVTFLNEAAEKVIGWSESELLGKSLHAAIHYQKPDGSPFPEHECRMTAVLRTGQIARGEEFYTRREGSMFPASFAASPIIADGRCIGVVKVFHDITETKALVAEVQRQRERAEEASQNKTRLMSALSHDARTPLNAVALAAQLIELQLKDHDNPEVQECLRTIRDSVANVLELLSDVLNLTRIEAGVVPVELSRFELEPMLAECMSAIETQARLKGIECSINCGSLKRATLETDRAKLKQIVGNLLSNALKFTERGSIQLLTDRDGDTIQIGVQDSGVGIPPENQVKVFEEFETLSRNDGSRSDGFGLGLAICSRLAHLLRGTIQLKSELGSGSRFTIVFPATVVAPAQVSSAEAVVSQAELTTTGGTILVAEDHTASRQMLAKVLRRRGYRILEAANGRDVLEHLKREKPLAVLMDVNMPVMDGIETTAALRADPKMRGLAVFALTGEVTSENLDRIRDAGVDGFLEKPVSPDALKQALASIQRRA